MEIFVNKFGNLLLSVYQFFLVKKKNTVFRSSKSIKSQEYVDNQGTVFTWHFTKKTQAILKDILKRHTWAFKK